MNKTKTLLQGIVCLLVIFLSACNQTEPVNSNEASTAVEEVSAPARSGIEQANIDKTVRPQDNFYRYMNGTWLKNNRIPADKTAIGSFYDLRDKSDEDVKALIEDLAGTENLTTGSDEQKVADLFRSFMNKQALEKAGVEPVQSVLDVIAKISTKEELAKFLGQYGHLGITNPLNLYVSVDAKESTRYAVHAWQGGLGLLILIKVSALWVYVMAMWNTSKKCLT